MLEAAFEGLSQILTPNSLGLMCLGVLLGSIVGFLPGIGGPSTLAIMLPFVMTMKDPFLVIALLVGFDAVAVRSASRLGYSDLGVNRRRIENLRALLVGRGIVGITS